MRREASYAVERVVIDGRPRIKLFRNIVHRPSCFGSVLVIRRDVEVKAYCSAVCRICSSPEAK
jgi:hypothetical protein